jgi:hypothetical protein
LDQNCQGSVPTETDYQREAVEMLKRYQEIASRKCKVELDEKENLASTSEEGGQKI